MKRLIIVLLILLISSFSALALEYTVQVTSPSKVNTYEGVYTGNVFGATITNNAGICDITCDWSTDLGNTHGEGLKVTHNGGTKSFNFNVLAQGSNGVASYSLTVTCKRITGFDCWTEGTEPKQSGPFSFSYLYAGDGICTTEKERCDNYLSYKKDSACTCSSDKECKPNSNRGADDKGCATFCGNNKVEKQYETCDSCPNDVGKCDGLSCVSANECEGNYCVHNVCSPLSYIKGDSYCDINEAENCKNSASDCACGANKRCSSAGVCETYCGNGVCEASEQGICKADCDWCGDGTCQNSESCSSCSVDCGECKKPTKQEELQRNIKSTNTQQNKNQVSATKTESSKQQISEVFNENKKTFLIAGVVLVIALFALGFYLWKRKKEAPRKKKEHETRCPKCHKKIKDNGQKFCHNCGHKIEHEKHKEDKSR